MLGFTIKSVCWLSVTFVFKIPSAQKTENLGKVFLSDDECSGRSGKIVRDLSHNFLGVPVLIDDFILKYPFFNESPKSLNSLF